MKLLPFNKEKNMLLLLLFCLLSQFAGAQMVETQDENTDVTTKNKRCNFYVFTQDADKKFDFLGTTALIRIRIKSIFLKKKLYVIVARNGEQVSKHIISILKKRKALVGNVWFDSHGLYKQGYSSVHIGSDEFSYKNINDSLQTNALHTLATYCDKKTNIGLGSCYGGATFNFPGSAKTPAGRMNGDSLMIGMGKIFEGSTIYGSESWVMAKPGIFNDNFGFAGYPLGKRYRTTYWKPVWERLGQWNKYNTTTNTFEPINTVALHNDGSIRVRARHYQELNKGQKAVAKNLVRLESDVMN